MWFLVCFLVFENVNCQQSAQYLHSAVRDLRKLNNIQTFRRLGAAATKGSQSIEPKLDFQVQPTARRAHQVNDVSILSMRRVSTTKFSCGITRF